MKIGDTIKFVNQSGTALIKELRRNSVVAEDEFGFEEEYLLKDILVENFELKNVKVQPKEVEAEQPKPKKNILLKEKVIDLHFTQLVDYPDAYSAHEKLQVQLKTAVIELEKGRKTTEKLILIHGKGSGKLEEELLKILRKTAKIQFYDADFKRYKLGAVEIKYL